MARSVVYWVHWQPTQKGAEASIEMQYPSLEQAERDLPHELTVRVPGDPEPTFITDHLAWESEMITNPYLGQALDDWLDFELELLTTEERVLWEFQQG